MTQEDKELLLKDLCARLPYGVKIKLIRWDIDEGMYINTTLEPDDIERLLNDEEGDTEIKSYLFPLSSMTEEQEREYNTLRDFVYAHHCGVCVCNCGFAAAFGCAQIHCAAWRRGGPERSAAISLAV